MSNTQYSGHYTEEGFWGTVKKYAKSIGKEGLRNALMMFYALKDHSSSMPVWAKTAIIGALGYLISPIDAIPDIIPIVGLTDDIGVIAAALAAVRMYIPEEAARKADKTVQEWFG